MSPFVLEIVTFAYYGALCVAWCSLSSHPTPSTQLLVPACITVMLESSHDAVTEGHEGVCAGRDCCQDVVPCKLCHLFASTTGNHLQVGISKRGLPVPTSLPPSLHPHGTASLPVSSSPGPTLASSPAVAATAPAPVYHTPPPAAPVPMEHPAPMKPTVDGSGGYSTLAFSVLLRRAGLGAGLGDWFFSLSSSQKRIAYYNHHKRV